MTTPLDAGDSITADFLAELAAIAGVVKHKTVDETVNNSTTYQNDDTFVWPVEASKVYQVELVIHYSTGTTPDIKFQWSLPSGALMNWGVGGIQNATTAYVFRGGLIAGNDYGLEGHASNIQIARIVGVVTIGNTPGAVILQWTQVTANASNTIVKQGSYGVMRQVS